MELKRTKSQQKRLQIFRKQLQLDLCAENLWHQIKTKSPLDPHLLVDIQDDFTQSSHLITSSFGKDLVRKLHCTRFCCGLSENTRHSKGSSSNGALDQSCYTLAETIVKSYPFKDTERSHFLNMVQSQIFLTSIRNGFNKQAARIYNDYFTGKDPEDDIDQIYVQDMKSLLDGHCQDLEAFHQKYSYEAFLENVVEFLDPVMEKCSSHLEEKMDEEALELARQGRIPLCFLEGIYKDVVKPDKENDEGWEDVISVSKSDVQEFKKQQKSAGKVPQESSNNKKSKVTKKNGSKNEAPKKDATVTPMPKDMTELSMLTDLTELPTLKDATVILTDISPTIKTMKKNSQKSMITSTSIMNSTHENKRRTRKRNAVDSSSQEDDEEVKRTPKAKKSHHPVLTFSSEDEFEKTDKVIADLKAADKNLNKAVKARKESVSPRKSRRWNDVHNDRKRCDWDSESSDEEIESRVRGLSTPKRCLDISIPRAKPRRKKNLWSTKEIEYLKEGVIAYGEGNWSSILKNYDFEMTRTSVDLKDKWRNMNKDKDK